MARRAGTEWRDYVAGAALALLAALPVGAAGFDLQGHRGARGLAPENTLAGFRAALAIGVHTLEADLGVSRDGVLVVAHDPRLNPALVRHDGRWLEDTGPPLRALTLAELQRYDVGRLNPARPYGRQWSSQQPADGERMPALTELLTLVRQRRTADGAPVRLNLETKITPTSGDEVIDAAAFARLLVTVLQGARMTGRVTVQSFDWRTLREVKRLAPDIDTACLTIEAPNFDTVRVAADGASPWHAGLKPADHGGSLLRVVRAAGCAIWSPFWRNVTPELLAEARALGLRVLPWTVNDPADMDRLIAAGVDGLITDYPDRARAVMQARGLKLP